MQIVYGSTMDPYRDLTNVNISLEICVNVFQRAVHGPLHGSYVDPMCSQLIQTVNISFEIFVNVFQLIQNVNMSFEICTSVAGSCADHSNNLIFHWKYIRCVPADPTCQYFIRNICNCVRDGNS